MVKYCELNYVIPPVEQGQIIQCSYAITPDEVVRLTRDNSDGTSVYQSADACELIGEFEPWNRVPSVPRTAWTMVDPNEETPS